MLSRVIFAHKYCPKIPFSSDLSTDNSSAELQTQMSSKLSLRFIPYIKRKLQTGKLVVHNHFQMIPYTCNTTNMSNYVKFWKLVKKRCNFFYPKPLRTFSNSLNNLQPKEKLMEIVKIYSIWKIVWMVWKSSTNSNGKFFAKRLGVWTEWSTFLARVTRVCYWCFHEGEISRKKLSGPKPDKKRNLTKDRLVEIKPLRDNISPKGGKWISDKAFPNNGTKVIINRRLKLS